MRRLWAISRKEFFHIVYDPRTLAIVILMPVIQLVMYGYAFNLEVEHVNVAVVDRAHTVASEHLVDAFRGSRSFHVFPFEGRARDIDGLFKARLARAALVIPPDFDRRLRAGAPPDVQVLVDASDPNAAQLIGNYCRQTVQAYNARRNPQARLAFELRPAILFNPNLTSAFFFVPGVIAMILIMISALLTSITIAREKETGTMEQILVSPVRSYEIILGKVLPYLVLAFLEAAMIVVVGLLLFHVPFRGSISLLVWLTLLYILTSLSLGLMISTGARTQQVAMMGAQSATVLPTIMLSGLIFPIASMPKILQYVSYLIPARYYLLMVRGVMLKGSSFTQLLGPALGLVLMTLVLLVVSVRRFSTRLEG